METILELLVLSWEQIMKIRNIGEVGADEIERWIKDERRRAKGLIKETLQTEPH